MLKTFKTIYSMTEEEILLHGCSNVSVQGVCVCVCVYVYVYVCVCVDHCMCMCGPLCICVYSINNALNHYTPHTALFQFLAIGPFIIEHQHPSQ